ncbi:MAG: ABC transporter substrate-binding protein [Oscillospiraceae bacterium]|nr:ABC transporter substrate-binding protein [Oscillospiraceae bacterium]
MKRYISGPGMILSAFAAVLLMSSCSEGGAAGLPPEQTVKTPPEISAGIPPADVRNDMKVTVTDFTGREMTVPDRVDSVACLYAYIGQAVVLLDGGDKLSAVVAGMQRDELLMRKVPHIAEMPVPFRASAINIESLMGIKPDVTLIRYETAANPGEIENLEKSGLFYAVVDYRDIEQQKASIKLVGDIIGKTENAEKYLDYYDKTLDLIRSRTAGIPDDKRVSVYHSVNEVVRTNHPNEISYYVLEAVGCVNTAKDFNTAELGGKLYVNVEQIYLWDPDVVIANEAEAVEYFRTNEAFEGLRAVRENRVYQLPVGASRWGHPGSIETPIAALYIAKLLYPEYFEDIDIYKEITDFYHDFWLIDLEEEETESIISGVGMREPKAGSR